MRRRQAPPERAAWEVAMAELERMLDGFAAQVTQAQERIAQAEEVSRHDNGTEAS